MLNALIRDFKTAGHKVTTLIDSRLKVMKPPIAADETIFITSTKEYEEKIITNVQESDFVYTIAPETNKVLPYLLDLVENAQGVSLNSSKISVIQASDKAFLYKILKKKNLPTPKTIKETCKRSSDQILNRIKKLGFPVIVKPRIGAGCQGLSLVNKKEEIEGAITKIKNLPEEDFVIQRLIKGKAASICLISTGKKALPLTLNRQFVNLSSPYSESSYKGGMMPFNHFQQEQAFNTAKSAVESFPGLKGLIGVDLVITEKEPIVIEINPRITLSYVGLRHVISSNPAQMMIDVTTKEQLPKRPQFLNCALFSKIKVASPPYGKLQSIYKSLGVLSPPFPLKDEKESHCLLVAVTKKRSKLEREFNKIENNLRNLVKE